ncbi:carboxylesterase family protein [Nocardia bhagyanarayanae]|uniref:Carboxylic ester hydrolase n=1 Tax=Nocardia bhagyanarayanae TaxID=1215925 RepID=A0A543F8N1_9NOCA|nr:carboxylesterase family protein [Nocardia bhagyanarayanae]TQM30182.1 para-nitrobenzyl esterase [Nocardia bhagyanarayanae]
MDDVVLGGLRGESADGVVAFRNIRYARAERFEPPERIPAHDGTRDATSRGPSAPQLPSRLGVVMGVPAAFEQSEDCLVLTVTAPAGAVPGGCAVLVWLHGGAYLTGGGEWNLYDADRLVRETGIVVVSVSYRLGVLGYLRAPGVSPGNLGLLDQLTALEWVRDNIRAFGGDPARVTVAGQSAGAQSVVAMLGIGRAEGLFARAIVQSAPFGVGFHRPADAERAGAVFLGELGGDPRTADVPEILAAQARTAVRLAGPGGLNSAPPFLPVRETEVLPGDEDWRRLVRERAARTPVLVGSTAAEMRAFYGGPHPVFGRVRRTPVIGARLTAAAERTVGRKVFEDGVFRFADLLTESGGAVFCYRFGVLHPDGPFGACHCIELPLLFGAADDWRAAPMVRPLDSDRLDELGVRTRGYWGEFVRTGSIGDRPPHRRGSRAVLELP